MKKIVSVLLVSAMLVTALTACDNKPADDSSDNSSVSDNSASTNTESSESSDSAPASDGSSTEDSAPESDPDDSIVVPDDPNNPAGDGEMEGADNSGLVYPDSKAGNMAKAAISTDAWPYMDVVVSEYIEALFNGTFNLDDCEEYCFVSNSMSTALNKVVVIKPKEGSEDAVSAAVDSYLEAVKTDPNIAFYPGQQASADGAVSGKTDDGYYYLIVHEKGEEIETAMLAAE